MWPSLRCEEIPHARHLHATRSWIVLFLCCFLLLPLYVFAAPLLKLLGQADDVSIDVEHGGSVAHPVALLLLLPAPLE
ncbi:hypothetical protein NL676_026097 [Syzygium grande]|nr:hypothetical protein NL676_026097 [Syzygium grande]